MRIVFMGTPEFAVPTLKALVESGHTVVGVVTQPDKPRGRGQSLSPPPIKVLAESHGIPVRQPEKIKAPGFLDVLKSWNPDCIVVTAFGRILPKSILELPPKGCINVHASLLPAYRGAAPIQWAVMNGETQTGITTMLMDEGMDTGDVLLQEIMTIRPDETAGELSARLAQLGGKLLVDTLRRWEAGTLVPRPQDHAKATYAPMLKKEAGNIDWTQPSQRIANTVRGLSPWPGTYTYWESERLMIWKAQPVPSSGEQQGGEPGAVVSMGVNECLVATGGGLLAILELQPANKKRMSIEPFLRGHPLKPGMRFRSTPSG